MALAIGPRLDSFLAAVEMRMGSRRKQDDTTVDVYDSPRTFSTFLAIRATIEVGSSEVMREQV